MSRPPASIECPARMDSQRAPRTMTPCKSQAAAQGPTPPSLHLADSSWRPGCYWRNPTAHVSAAMSSSHPVIPGSSEGAGVNEAMNASTALERPGPLCPCFPPCTGAPAPPWSCPRPHHATVRTPGAGTFPGPPLPPTRYASPRCSNRPPRRLVTRPRYILPLPRCSCPFVAFCICSICSLSSLL